MIFYQSLKKCNLKSQGLSPTLEPTTGPLFGIKQACLNIGVFPTLHFILRNHLYLNQETLPFSLREY